MMGCIATNKVDKFAHLFCQFRQSVSTMNQQSGDIDLRSLQLYFVARVAVYITLSGFLVIFIFFLVKYIGVYEVERHEDVQSVEENSETCPLMPQKNIKIPYGIAEEDEEDEELIREIRNSEDLFNGNICAVCYGAPRNCFYVPCGHCATCYACAQRIRDGENKACPICRRSIRKIRKLCIVTQELEC